MVYTERSYAQKINMFMSQVYGWMSLALALTAATAYYCATSGYFLQLIKTSPWIVFGIFIAQVCLVIVIAGFLNKLNSSVAFVLFFLYALLTGVTFSALFLVYTMGSIAATFLVTSVMFASMALYGYFTRADLSGMGSILIMMVIGMIFALLVNLFLQNQTFDYLISGAGVVIFSLLTAYDVQKLKMLGQYALSEPSMKQRFVIIGALTLYLDFVNLFINLVRFMGRKKD